MRRSKIFFGLLPLFLDFFASFLAWIFAWKIRPITDLIPFFHRWFDPYFVPSFERIFCVAFFSAIAFAIIAFFARQYAHHSPKNIAPTLFATLFWGMGILSFFDLVFRELIFSRVMLAQAMFFTVVISLFFHFLGEKIKAFLFQKNIGVSRVFCVPNDLFSILPAIPDFVPAPIKEEADEIWVFDSRPQESAKWRNYCFQHQKVFRFLPQNSDAFARMNLEIFRGIPLLRPIPSAISGSGRFVKRLFDIIVALILLAFLFPLFVIIAVNIRRDSAGPIFYKSLRIGRGGKKFLMLKFRSMVKNAETLKKKLSTKNHRTDSPLFKIKNDPRITPFGFFLRRYSLDEWPQLWNVLRGEMSLIGPRPHLPHEVAQFSAEYRRSLAIKPGISGLSQINGRSDLPFSEEMRLDLLYLENWSFWWDIKIALKTPLVLIKGNGAD